MTSGNPHSQRIRRTELGASLRTCRQPRLIVVVQVPASAASLDRVRSLL